MMALRAAAVGMACTMAAPNAGAQSGADLYHGRCSTCHDAGVASAPKLGDRAEWMRRAAPGRDALYRAALFGVPNTAMLAKGGFSALSDAEVRAAVDYMLAQAGMEAPARPPAAAPSATRRDAQFALLDTNKDGFLSRTEAARDPGAARLFTRYDANRDGRLSEIEYRNLDATLMRANAQADVADAELERSVRAALAGTQGLIGKDVKLEVAGGIVSLKGVVDDGNQVALAELAAKRVKGVKRVDNKLISKHEFSWD